MPDGTNDYSKVLQELYKDSKSEELILFEKEDIMGRYDELCEVLKECDKEKKTIEQYLQMHMKDYEIAYLGDRKISWKKQSRSSIDTKKLREDYPEIVEEYVKTTNTRVFKVS